MLSRAFDLVRGRRQILKQIYVDETQMQNMNSSWHRVATWMIFMGTGVQVMATDSPPTLHLVREGQNVSQLRILKMAREQCLSEKRMYLETQRTKPQLWAALEKDMQKKRKGYDVNRLTSPEPDWSKVAVQREEEFFHGEKYAHISEGARYKLADDGSCTLLVDKIRKAELDDSVSRYDLDFIKGTGVKKPSSVALHRQLPPGVSPNKPAINDHDTVAGQRCDYLPDAKGQRAKSCYWSTLHRYPSVMQRPVILKSIVTIGNDVNTEQAVLFEQPSKIDDAIFRAPKGIQLKDLSLR